MLSTRALLHRNSWHTSRPGKACTVLDECAFAIFGSIWLNCYNVARIPSDSPLKTSSMFVLVLVNMSTLWTCNTCWRLCINKIKKHFLAEATCRSIRCFFDCALLYSQEGAKIGQIDADCIAPSENSSNLQVHQIILHNSSGCGSVVSRDMEHWMRNELHPTEVVPFFRTPGMYEGPLRALLNCCLRLHLFFEQHLNSLWMALVDAQSVIVVPRVVREVLC